MALQGERPMALAPSAQVSVWKYSLPFRFPLASIFLLRRWSASLRLTSESSCW